MTWTEIHCLAGEGIRLQGTGAIEMDGTCGPSQPCVPDNLLAQRRVRRGY
jgi:hypothetical protein